MTDETPTADAAVSPYSQAPHTRRRRWVRPLRDFGIILLIACLTTTVVKAVAFRGFVVPSQSMFPTLMTDDRIGVELISPRFQGYERGDVVVFRDPADWLGDGEDDAFPNPLQLLGLMPESRGYIVKRILGMPGETIAGLADGTLLIDGAPLADTYAVRAPQTPFEHALAADEFFVLGDNRAHSADSRVHGAVKRDDLVGPVSFIFLPVDRLGTLGR